jgi:hypothetical protein
MFACAAAAMASRSRPGSARPSELLFDLAVGGRLWRKLVEGCVEEAVGVFVSTLAAADNGEVCDHSSLVLLVAELSQDVERLLEVPNRHGDAAVMHESESEVVERQRLGLPVTELTHDRERGTMLLGCLFVLAFTSKLRPELIESKRLTLAVDRDWFRPKGLRGARFQLADHRGVTGREAPQSLPEPELAEPRPLFPESPLDRTEGRLQPQSHRIAAQEPRPSYQGTPDER